MVGLYIIGWLAILCSGFAQSGSFETEIAYINEIRNGAGQRISGGWAAADGQFPSTVSLRMVGPAGGVGACTGSILTEEWILTAAHCVARRVTVVVYIGQTNITHPGYMLESTERYWHPKYDEAVTYVQTDDIGLLKVERHIEYGDYIQPIRIQSSQRRDIEYGGERLTISGYGRTDDWWLGGYMPEILYWVYQTGITLEECWGWYPYSDVLDLQTVCTQYYNHTSQNPCAGDSGGALTIVDLDGKETQVGIMSFGAARGCNSVNAQGYVRPEFYHEWLTNVTGVDFDWDPEKLTSSAPSFYTSYLLTYIVILSSFWKLS